ncbi:MAG: VWA domain-containing protein [bacterium]
MHTRHAFLSLVAVAMIAGCGPDQSGSGTLPNGDPLPDGLSQTSDGYIDSYGNECATPTPCGNCDFDCKPAGNPFREPGPIGPNDECAELTVNLTEAIPTVVLLVDQSGSMTANFGNQNRWEATYSSLMNPNTGLVSTLQDRFRFGFALYTSFNGGQTCPNLRDVRPEFNNYAAIDRVFSNSRPEDDTPTGASILGTLRQFEENPVRGPKILLLATDGEPDTCDVPDPRNNDERQAAQQESVAAVEEAFSRGVQTVVLSVGDQVGEQHLQEMAIAGAGGQTAPFYRANDPDQLKNQLEQIITGSRDCIFQVDGGILDPRLVPQGSIQVNGNAVPYGDSGWVFHQDEQVCFGAKQCIELKGPTCDSIQHGDAQVGGNFLCVYNDPKGDNGYGTTVPGTVGNGDPDLNTIPTNPSGTCGGPGASCSYDGDCCSGLCGRTGTGGTCIVQ